MPGTRLAVSEDVKTRLLHEAGFSAVELLLAVAILASIAAMSMPISTGMIDDIRLRGDAQGLSSGVAQAKMTAATRFTRARLRINVAAASWQIEYWRPMGPPGWIMDGGQQLLSSGGAFGAGPVTTPPPNSQAVVGQPAPCLADDGTVIAGTACVHFNSRGLPVSSAGVPVTAQVLYMRGPTGVFGIVLGATGQLQVWRASLSAGGGWHQR